MTARSALDADVLARIEADTSRDVGERFLDLAASYLEDTLARRGTVSTRETFATLATRFDEPMPRNGRDLDEIVARLRDDVVAESNHLYDPRYMGHQVSPPLPAAIWTESLIGALNQSTAVWEMSPVGTVIEHRVMRWLADLAGLPPTSGGTLTSGGTEATFAALLAARAALYPDAWRDGIGTAPPLLICGEHTHYAVSRAAGEMGIGTANVLAIGSREFRMDVVALRDALERAKRERRAVLAVVATAGSTATGSFDDLDAIADVCDAHGVWLHVDGAHGASALFSATHRDRVRGISRARSIAWDPHKMMLMPLSAGAVLVRDERDLDAAFAQRAPYLFHGAGDERVLDQGVRSFQCSRRADAIKIWVALQRYGADGIGGVYNHLADLASHMHALVRARDDFEAIHEPECNIFCFRWHGALDPSHPALDTLNRELRERFNRSGAGWITTTVLDGRRVLRVTIMNPRTTRDDLSHVLDGLSTLGAQLVAEEGA